MKWHLMDIITLVIFILCVLVTAMAGNIQAVLGWFCAVMWFIMAKKAQYEKTKY